MSEHDWIFNNGLSEAEIAKASHPMSNTTCGIYFLLQKGEVVYVGRSGDCHHRISIHTKEKEFDAFYVCPAKPEECDLLEFSYILKFQPKYNCVLPKTTLYTSLNVLKREHPYIDKRIIKKRVRESGMTPVFLHNKAYYRREVVNLFNDLIKQEAT